MCVSASSVVSAVLIGVRDRIFRVVVVMVVMIIAVITLGDKGVGEGV